MESATSPRRPTLAPGWLVRTAVAISILLVMGMTALLWHRWTTAREQTMTFDSSNLRATMLVGPGKYTLSRTHGAAPLPEEQITIDPHTPQTIELPRIE